MGNIVRAEQLNLIDAKVDLARRFDELHELIYRRGGVRPVNAAIDELCKLLLLRVHAAWHPDAEADGVRLSTVMNAAYIRSLGSSAPKVLRAAFAVANAHPDYHWGEQGGFFLEGDTLRLTDTNVLAEAVDLVSSISIPAATNAEPASVLAEQDSAGLAFEVFLRGRYEHSGGLGTYLTPEPVVEAMTEMAVAMLPADRLAADDLLIGDPCAGTGRFLISAMRHVEARQRGLGIADARRVEDLRQTAFLGADQSDSSLLKARLNFLMYGVMRPRLIRVDDSIVAPEITNLIGKFDMILTNPPFGDGKYDRPEGLAALRRDELEAVAGWTWRGSDFGTRTPVDRADPAVLFWDFDLSLLRPGGLLGIVLPDGALGPKYSWLHDALLDGVGGRAPKAELLAVVSLPRQTFALSGTAAKTSFLILRRRDDETPHRKVFLARSQHVGYVQRGRQMERDPEGNDLPAIASAFAEYIAGRPVAGELWDVVPKSSMRRGLDANGTALASPMADVPRIGEVATARKRHHRGRKAGDAFFLSILHVGSDCLVDWVAARDYSPKTPGRDCREGDVIVSCLNPQIPRVTFIPQGAGDGLCSAEFAVLEPVNIDSAKLALLIRSDEVTAFLAASGRGTSSSRRRIDVEQILGARLPDFDLDDAVVDQFREAVEADARARATLAQVLGRLR